MYCIYCGKKIKEEDRYCKYCGKKVKKETFLNSKEMKIGLLLVGIACILTITVQVVKTLTSPNYVSYVYMKNIQKKNYKALLKNTNQTTFVNEKTLESLIENDEDYQIKDFQVDSCEMNEEPTCKITILTKKKGTITKRLHLQGKKLFNLIKTYQIKDEWKTKEDWYLYLPENSEAYLDGISLDSYKTDENQKEHFDGYKIPSILEGTHELDLTWNTMTLHREIHIEANAYTYNLEKNDLEENMNQLLIQKSIHTIELLYQSIEEKKSFEEIPNIENDLKETYQKLQQKDVEKITNYQIANANILGMQVENGEILITMQLTYQYEIKEAKKEKNDTCFITFDNTLKNIKKIDSLVTYFSEK